jgi:hypothetical protein
MNYRIAIPSKGRAYSLFQKTIRTLKDAGFPADIIDIFVVQEELYKYALYGEADPHYKNLIVGVPGLAEQRQFIQHYYPLDQNILFIDDDIEGFKVLPDLPPIPQIFQEMFLVLISQGLHLGGVYPCDNKFFLKKRIVKGGVYCVGACFCLINDRTMNAPFSDREDFWNTCHYLQQDGAVLRNESIAIKTKYWKNPGGLQETRTQESVEASANEISNLFPEYLSPPFQKRKGSSIIWNVRMLRNLQRTSLPLPNQPQLDS